MRCLGCAGLEGLYVPREPYTELLVEYVCEPGKCVLSATGVLKEANTFPILPTAWLLTS